MSLYGEEYFQQTWEGWVEAYEKYLTKRSGMFILTNLHVFLLAHLAKGKVKFCHHLASVIR
jgi:hypothetical protein